MTKTMSCLFLLACLMPAAARAIETRTETVGRCQVVTETEGPYVECGTQGFALPSIETAVSLTSRDFNKLRQFLVRHCVAKPGCVLTYETETKAVIGAGAPSGQSLSLPYRQKAKKTAPGTPRSVRTTLRAWSYDTYSLTARTDAGTFCIPNDYAWKDYNDRAREVLSGLGEQETQLAVPVEVTAFPLAGATVEDCKGFLGGIALAR